jgi:two-component system sensor histidine kinase/response regulator
LIGNALKFQNNNVQPKVQVIVNCDENDIICFDVIDNGIGIPIDRRNHLFENFVQLDSGISRKYGGTGLGLAISKHIAECMGGRIWLKSSESGVGSTFSFEYKVKRAQAISQVIDITIPQTRCTLNDAKIAKCRVLIAEDNKINQKVMLRMLGAMGIADPVMVDDGEKAVNEFSKNEFDIVILDLNMPVMNGLEAAKLMRMIEVDGKHVPIIACTADATEIQHIECIKAGMDVVVTKPVVKQTLKDVMLKLLQET